MTTATLADTSYVIDLTGSPPDAEVSAAYTYTFTAVNTEAPVTFVKTAGTLPPGLTLSTAGVLSGTAGATEATYAFSITLTDVNGVDTVKAYSVRVKDTAVPGNLLDYLIDWWTFDNTLISEVGAKGFDQTYAGGTAYETGLKSQQLIPTVAHRCSSGLSDNQDWSMSFWLDMSGTITHDMGVGVGVNSALDTNYHAAFFVNTSGQGGTYIRDAGSGGTEVGSYLTLTPVNDRVHVCLSWDESALTLTSYVNGVFYADEVLGASPPSGAVGYVFCTAYGSTAFAEINPHLDEMGVFSNYALTLADAVYLYNAAAGKSYAEVVEDGVL